MKLSSVEFEMSAPELALCPEDALPEFAFIGRSNVGKSSLLNMLTGRKDLARVSKTPGHTKLINLFAINRRWRLVDLPGYGYAEGARNDRDRFGRIVARYLEHRKNLRGVFVLVDSGLEPQKIDLEFLQWIARISAPAVLVFTKTDRNTPTKVQRHIDAFMTALAPLCEQPPEFFKCSALTGDGRTELLAAIDQALAAEPAVVAAETPAASAPAKPARKAPVREKVPTGNAPWLRAATTRRKR